jgi:hypothetical protein
MEFDLKKCCLKHQTMTANGVHMTFVNMEHNHHRMLGVKCTGKGIRFETILDNLTAMFIFKCLIMKSLWQFLHLDQGHGFQMIQQ